MLSESKRRGLLRVALGVALTALLLLAAIAVGRTLYLDAINQNVLPRQAAADIFDALIVAMRTSLRIAFLAAVILTGLALLAGRPLRVAVEKGGPALRDAAARMAADPRTTWLAEHRSAVQWSVVVFGGIVLVAWDNPTAGVVLIDVALIAVAVWLVGALARSGRRVELRGVNRAPGATRLHRRPDERRGSASGGSSPIGRSRLRCPQRHAR